MTDLEITKHCAEAMGLLVDENMELSAAHWENEDERSYDPLHNDAQAMALVKEYGLEIMRLTNRWHVSKRISEYPAEGDNSDLNHAICECVAKMEANK